MFTYLLQTVWASDGIRFNRHTFVSLCQLGSALIQIIGKRSTIEIARETTNLGQTPLNRSQQFSAPYKRLPDRPLANYL